ncbi:hypothetical protein [Nocardia sp. NPDC046763]|uniref:hypothetical protein n=1 Tax=Nocardia sp. NPDC046763 TaxID=3155256 RepID=UPI0033FBAA43
MKDADEDIASIPAAGAAAGYFSPNSQRPAVRWPSMDGTVSTMASDHLLAAVLDVLAEVDPAAVFDARDVLRSVRPAVDPVPGLDAVDEVLALLALPMLGGIVAAGDRTYRAGVSADVVLARLARLTKAVDHMDDENLDDRY